jgi:hypothetical protein
MCFTAHLKIPKLKLTDANGDENRRFIWNNMNSIINITVNICFIKLFTLYSTFYSMLKFGWNFFADMMELNELNDLLTTMVAGKVSPEEFQEKATLAQALTPALDDNQKLLIYGLYKHVTSGPVTTSPPTDQQSIEFFKW